MSSIKKQQLSEWTVKDLMIPAEKVAHVQLGNPVEHALLVLVESGYSSVPVLDREFRYLGTIGKTPILKSVIGIERFEMEKLSEIAVEEVMNTTLPTLSPNTNFVTGLKEVIDHAFLCVVDEEGHFLGILTRRAILKEILKSLYI